jgi:uncharacterized membrane protein YkoI
MKTTDRMHHHVAALLSACLAWTTAGAHEYGEDSDQGRARHALKHGEVRPLAGILEAVLRDTPGEVLDVEFEGEHRHAPQVYIYEIKLLGTDGFRHEVKVDAATGRLLSREAD